jgi:uncharacterized paraquat-inducible protein A
MNVRSLSCVVLFIIAYILLIPGLTCLLFSAKAEVFGMTVVDMEKSTLGAIHLLYENGRWPAAAIILLCSVFAPFCKLAVLLVCAYLMSRGNTGPAVCSAITAVRRISKWATVDAFTASILVAFFATSNVLHVELHKGYYFFVGYCIFSTAGALVMERPALESDDECQRLLSSTGVTQKALGPVAVGTLVLGVLLVVLFRMPLFKVECTLLSLQEQVSFATMVWRLLQYGSRSAVLLCVACVGLIPAADMAWCLAEATTGVAHPMSEWLQDFAMLEVFALAILVTQNASYGVNQSLSVELLPGGWFFVASGAAWLLYSIVFRSRTSRSPTTRDKLGAGVAFASAIDSEAQS